MKIFFHSSFYTPYLPAITVALHPLQKILQPPIKPMLKMSMAMFPIPLQESISIIHCPWIPQE